MLVVDGERTGRAWSDAADKASSEMLEESGLGGRLPSRDVRFGGWGKDSMLTVFLKDFCPEDVETVEGEMGDMLLVVVVVVGVLRVGTAGEEWNLAGLGVGMADAVTERDIDIVVGDDVVVAVAVDERRANFPGKGIPEA